MTEEDALPQTEEEKKAAEEKAEAGKPGLEAVKEALGDQVRQAGQEQGLGVEEFGVFGDELLVSGVHRPLQGGERRHKRPPPLGK